MRAFSKKQIRPEETLGSKLTKQRKQLGLTVEEIALKIKVQQKYLKALEEGDYKNLPAEIYSKNFLRKLLEVLHLPREKYVNLFLEEQNSYKTLHSVKKNNQFIKKVGAASLISTPKIIRSIIIILIIILLIGYLALKIKKITSPPQLIINYPQKNITVKQSSITVEGRTEKEAKITINGQEVFNDGKGYFKKNIELQKGINIIKITAKKKHSKKNIIYRTVMVKK